MVLEIIVLLSTIVTAMETWAVIITLHPNGNTAEAIAARMIAPKLVVY